MAPLLDQRCEVSKGRNLHHLLRLRTNQTVSTTEHPLATNLSRSYLLTFHHLGAILTPTYCIQVLFMSCPNESLKNNQLYQMPPVKFKDKILTWMELTSTLLFLLGSNDLFQRQPTHSPNAQLTKNNARK